MGQRLSIITPVFNCEKFIAQAIESVIDQRCDVCEHIIVDGGSSDGTMAIVKQMALKYSHLHWVSEPDKGQSDAMNKGIEMARGDIIGILNADDYYEPNIFESIIAEFSTLPVPSVLVGNCTIWKDEGVVDFFSRPSLISLKNLLLGLYLEAFPMNSSAYFYHKSLHDRVGPYDVDDHFSMDLQFIYRALMTANVVYRDKSFGNFRYFEGTKTHSDYQSGGNQERVRQVTEKYVAMMPGYYQFYLKFLKLRRGLLGF